MGKYRTAKIVAVVVSLILVIFLLSQIRPDDIIETLSSVNPVFILLGFIIYLGSFVIQAVRFRVLLRNEISLSDLFNIVCIHTITNKMLPARTGEVSYIYLIKKICRKSTGEGIASLVASRIFDFLVLSIFFLISIALLQNVPKEIAGVLWIMQISLVLLIAAILLFLCYDERFIRLLYQVIARFSIQEKRIVQYLMHIADDTLQSYRVMKQRSILWKTFALTLGTWLLMYIFYGTLLYAFNIDVPFPAICLIVSVTAVLPLLPIYAVGGFGTTELTTTAFLVAFGVPSQTAIVASFGTHILGLLYGAIAGLYGLWRVNWKIF